MIGRAAFWLGVIALLTPHEPDIGLEHPSAGALTMSTTAETETAPTGHDHLELEFPALVKTFQREFRGRKPELLREIRESLRQRRQKPHQASLAH